MLLYNTSNNASCGYSSRCLIFCVLTEFHGVHRRQKQSVSQQGSRGSASLSFGKQFNAQMTYDFVHSIYFQPEKQFHAQYTYNLAHLAIDFPEDMHTRGCGFG